MSFADLFLQKFCVYGWIFVGAVLQKFQRVYTQQSAQVDIQKEKISFWHTILRHAKSSVLYLCSGGGEKDVCRPVIL